MRPQSVSDQEIEGVCRDLLSQSRRVLYEDVSQELRRRHGAKGRTGRVASILKRVRVELNVLSPPDNPHPIKEDPDLVALLERVRAAERRAVESEERERGNQEFFARRYAEQCSELEAERAEWRASRDPGVSKEQYLRLYQRAASFRERLAKYEPVESLFGERDAGAELEASMAGSER